MQDEQLRLEAIAADSRYAAGVNGTSVEYSARIFGRHFRPGRCLELGPAEGVVTAHLARHFPDLTLVEGSKRFCEQLRQRFPDSTVIHSLFEEFSPAQQWDTIVLGHVLEHVADPAALLRRVRDWLAPEGRLYAAVPNAHSLHRQAALTMGLLSDVHELNEADLHHGHRRVYDPQSFRDEFTGAGLRIQEFGGYWLKPLSNAQIEATWTPQMLDAFMQLGERYPEIAAEIYVIASA
jgi:2-polyprenyl-3-methyl-5-hydroxy-6-metoxy-1,4-benzoquinol methylase